VRRNLFSSPLNALLTILGLWLIWETVPPALNWAILNANWSGDGRTACEALPGEQAGACWVFIKIRLGVLFYGFYPEAERWRIDMAAIQLFAAWRPLHRQFLSSGLEKTVAGRISRCRLPGRPGPVRRPGPGSRRPRPFCWLPMRCAERTSRAWRLGFGQRLRPPGAAGHDLFRRQGRRTTV
jgi:hypothetical protein